MRLIGAATTVFLLTFGFVISGAGRSVGANPHDGREIFRFETFGDEQLWTDELRMHEVVQGVDPLTALNVLGLKVDVQALPQSVIKALKAGDVELDDPAVTRVLLRLNAIVGVIGTVNSADQITSIGITCALCHSTVDDSFDTGIGRRLDGWPNLDLDPGLILSLSLSTKLTPAMKADFATWGPGKYDARHHAFDGGVDDFVLLNGTGLTVPSVIPPAYGLDGVGFETFTGDGPISYWNAYVGIGQMGGQGTFIDPRIPLSIIQMPDLVTPRLQALLEYQLRLRAPAPPHGFFDKAAAKRGEDVFHQVGCATCHVPPTYTDVLNTAITGQPFLHSASEVGQDPTYAQRSVTGLYRTTPLRGLWQHAPYFHDGSAADLAAVATHYEQVFGFTLSTQQRADLIEFLKSL
jgi:mono/diheme cytochrome c family protein